MLGGGVPRDDGDPLDPTPGGRPSVAEPVAALPSPDVPGCPGMEPVP